MKTKLITLTSLKNTLNFLRAKMLLLWTMRMVLYIYSHGQGEGMLYITNYAVCQLQQLDCTVADRKIIILTKNGYDTQLIKFYLQH